MSTVSSPETVLDRGDSQALYRKAKALMYTHQWT